VDSSVLKKGKWHAVCAFQKREMINKLLSECVGETVGITPSVWYCARTKPKQEHIAAANLRKSLGLEIFLPRIQFERKTWRGIVRAVEPLFPCYIFIRTTAGSKLDEIRYASGISSLVHFGQAIPAVPDSSIAELKKCFATDEPVLLDDQIPSGCEVRVGNGAFAHLTGVVLRSLPARKRVQILLDILGRPTLVEIDQKSVLREKCSIAALMPSLAA
jgi:transcriptional antiterminator RfaH